MWTTTKVGTRKEGPWGTAADGDLPSWGCPAHTAPYANDFLVQSAGIPCKDMQFSYMGRGGAEGGGSEGKHSLLNCHFFLRGALNKYKRLNYQQLKLSLWWQPNRSNRFPRTFFIENWIWGPSLKGYTVTSSCRLSLGSLHISKAFQVQKDTENLLRWMSCFCVICWPSGIL